MNSNVKPTPKIYDYKNHNILCAKIIYIVYRYKTFAASDIASNIYILIKRGAIVFWLYAFKFTMKQN